MKVLVVYLLLFTGMESCLARGTTEYFLTEDFTDITTEESGGFSNRTEEVFERILQKLLESLDPIYLPEIPTLSFNSGDNVRVALSFTDFSICGLSSNLHVVNVDLPNPFGDKSFQIEINYSRISAEAGQYSAGGQIINMPFTGESYMSASLEDLKVEISLEAERDDLTCFVEGSSSFFFDVRKPVVNFNDLNPGTDQGILVNTVISSVVPDIVDYVTYSFNNEWHDAVDNILIGALNSVMCGKEV